MIDYPRLDISKLTNVELGRLILTDLFGGPPTYQNAMLWYARECQKRRQAIRLVRDERTEQ